MAGVEQRLFHQASNVSILGGVEDPVALPADLHQVGHAELGQVLGHGRRLGADVGGEVPDGVLAVQQGPQDPQAGVVRQQLEGTDGHLEAGVVETIFTFLRSHADSMGYGDPESKPQERGPGALSQPYRVPPGTIVLW